MLNIIQLCICTSVLEMWGFLCAFNEPLRDSNFMPDVIAACPGKKSET